VVDLDATCLTVVNDALGAARAYEAAAGGVRAWSNRPGALVIFLGMDARADAHAWRVLAAASWFLGDTAPIEGMRRLSGGTVIEAGPERVEERRTRALDRWVTPGGDVSELSAQAIEDALRQAREAGELWPGEAKVDLSGGRDSRVAAAAVLAAGGPARFLTSDATPGEADVARALIAAAPGDPPHEVSRTEAGSATPGTPLLYRAANLHLLHDGVRHPQKLRGPRGCHPPTISKSSASTSRRVSAIRPSLLLALVTALLVGGCSKGNGNIAGTYLEVEALGAPGMIRLEPDGSGAFVARLGGALIEDAFVWAHEDGDSYTASYASAANAPPIVEHFTFDDDTLVFDTDNESARYARVEDESAIPESGNDVPIPFFQ
jgi:hypothetical protein